MQLCCISLLLGFVLMLSLGVGAQPILPQPQEDQATREEIRRRQQQEQAEQQQRLEQPRVTLETPPSTPGSPSHAPSATPGLRPDADGIFSDPEKGFPIERITLDYGTDKTISRKARRRFARALRPVTTRFEGKKLGMPGIQQLIKETGTALIGEGFVTARVLLPEQDIAGSRMLRLLVVPGTVGKIVTTPAPASSRHGGTPWNAFPTHTGALLNIRDIEQGLEQMKRVPTQDATMDLVPGAQPGQTDIVITRKNKYPLRGHLGVDNSGDKNTGLWQGSATAFWDNPLFLNDLLSFTYNGAVASASGQGTQGDNLTYSVPFRRFTAHASYNTYKYHQTVQGYYNPYLSSGTSRSYEARLQYLAHRDQNSKTTLQARLTHRANRNFIDGTEIEVQRRDTTSLELALQHQLNLRRALLDTSVSWRLGLPWLDGADDPTDHLEGEPTFKYTILAADATLRAPFAIRALHFNFQTSLRAQITGDTLHGSEYFAIGGRYTVRGFDGRRTLGAEKGITLRNDLSLALWRTGQSLYAALDAGYVTGPANHYLPGSTLAGGALGLRGGWRCFYYDATVGFPLYKPAGLKTDRVTWTAQAGLQF